MCFPTRAREGVGGGGGGLKAGGWLNNENGLRGNELLEQLCLSSLH